MSRNTSCEMKWRQCVFCRLPPLMMAQRNVVPIVAYGTSGDLMPRFQLKLIGRHTTDLLVQASILSNHEDSVVTKDIVDYGGWMMEPRYRPGGTTWPRIPGAPIVGRVTDVSVTFTYLGLTRTAVTSLWVVESLPQDVGLLGGRELMANLETEMVFVRRERHHIRIREW